MAITNQQPDTGRSSRKTRNGRSAKGFVAGLWNKTMARKLHKKTQSYECLTENVVFEETPSKSTKSCEEDVVEGQKNDFGKIRVGLFDVKCWDVNKAVGYAALGSGVVDTSPVSVQPDVGSQEKRTSYFCDRLTNKQSDEQTKDTTDGSAEMSSRSPRNEMSDRVVDDKETEVVQKKKKSKRAKKKVIFLKKDGELQSLQMKSYVQLEDATEETETKKKRKKRRVTSKKVKKGAKKTGVVAWKGLKLSWKCLKYGLIQISQGPGLAFDVTNLAKPHTHQPGNRRYDVNTGRRRAYYA